MIVYKCDICGDEFLNKDGMVAGRYEHIRKIKLYKTGWDVEDREYKVRKTLELYKTTASIPIPSHDVKVKKDLCPRCIKKLEKP